MNVKSVFSWCFHSCALNAPARNTPEGLVDSINLHTVCKPKGINVRHSISILSLPSGTAAGLVTSSIQMSSPELEGCMCVAARTVKHKHALVTCATWMA